MKEIKVYYTFCPECDYMSDSEDTYEDIRYFDYCPECDAHLEIGSDWIPQHEYY